MVSLPLVIFCYLGMYIRWSAAVKRRKMLRRMGYLKGFSCPASFFCRSPSASHCSFFTRQDKRVINPFVAFFFHYFGIRALVNKSFLSILTLQRRITRNTHIHSPVSQTLHHEVHISLRPPPRPRPRLPSTAATSQRHRQQSPAQILMPPQRAGFLLRFQHSLGM